MRPIFSIGIIALLLAAWIGSLTFFIVDETEQVIKTQFGAPIGDPITEPGLKFKMPWQKANFFPKNILEWDGDPSQIPTKDKTFIMVDIFARWQIVDALTYFKKVKGEESRAQTQLDSILNAAVRNLIQSQPLIESVRNTNREMELEVLVDEIAGKSKSNAAKVTMGRKKITRTILEQAEPKVKELGIRLVDVRIKRINYIQSVRETVFERMIAERKQIAEKFRSEGQGESRKIQGRMEKELKTIQAEAYKQSQQIKGKADAEAAQIYADAYSKDQDFYALVKTLEMYKNLPEKEIELLLSTDSDFFKYIKGITP